MLLLIHALDSTCASWGFRCLNRAPVLVLFLTITCLMTKLKQLSNKFDVLFGEDSPWIGGVQCSQAAGSLSRDMGQERAL